MNKLIQLALASSYALIASIAVMAQGRQPSDAESCGACGACGGLGVLGVVLMIAIPVGIIALNIALLVWVARDAKARGMDSAVMWMVLVMFTSVVGLLIYIFSRPQGDLVQCPHCNNQRLQASAKCPNCGHD